MMIRIFKQRLRLSRTLICVGCFALIMVGCKRIITPSIETIPITFKGDQSTKADTDMPTPFTVIAYRSPYAFLEPDHEKWNVNPYFVEQYHANGAPYNPEKSYYYDNSSYYDFLAYSPLASESIIPSVKDVSTTLSPMLTFITPPDADVDLMHAKHSIFKGTSLAVPLLFNHVLVRVHFSAKGDKSSPNTAFKITGIKYTVSNNTNMLYMPNKAMNPLHAIGGKATYILKNIDDQKMPTFAFGDVTVNDGQPGCFYVVPQLPDIDAKIDITYSVADVVSTATLSISDVTLVGGTNINYRITLDNDVIECVASVTEWTDGSISENPIN